MARWLLIGCMAVVAIVVAIQMVRKPDSTAPKPAATQGVPPDPASADLPPGSMGSPAANSVSATPTPAAPPSPAVRDMQKRLLADDALRPPPPDAHPDVKSAYQQVIDAIARGNDPLRQSTTPETRRAQTQKRLEERRKTAEKRREEKRAERLAEQEEHDKKRRELRERSGDRNRPPASVGPLFPKPDLGPAVIFEDDGKKTGSQPTSPTPPAR
jgi:hypothetical protein